MISQRVLNLEVYTLESARRVKKRLPPRRRSSSPPSLWAVVDHCLCHRNNAPADSDDEASGVVNRKGSIRRKISVPSPPANTLTAEVPTTPPPVPLPASPMRDLVVTVEKAIATVAPDTDKVVGAVRRAESGLQVGLTKARAASQSVSALFSDFDLLPT